MTRRKTIGKGKNHHETNRRQIPCPQENSIADWLPGANLADAFAVEQAWEDAALGIEAIARNTLDHPASWFRALLSIYDKAVRPFGVKSSRRRLQAMASGAEQIDFFRVIWRSRTEVMLGEESRHLDFRASLLIRPRLDGEGASLIATTVPRCHNFEDSLFVGNRTLSSAGDPLQPHCRGRARLELMRSSGP